MRLDRQDFLKFMGTSHLKDMSLSVRIRGKRPMTAEVISRAYQTYKHTDSRLHTPGLTF